MAHTKAAERSVTKRNVMFNGKISWVSNENWGDSDSRVPLLSDKWFRILEGADRWPDGAEAFLPSRRPAILFHEHFGRQTLDTWRATDGIQRSQGGLDLLSSRAKRKGKYWLVVLRILKHISQWEGLSHILWKTKKMFQNYQPGFKPKFFHRRINFADFEQYLPSITILQRLPVGGFWTILNPPPGNQTQSTKPTGSFLRRQRNIFLACSWSGLVPASRLLVVAGNGW